MTDQNSKPEVNSNSAFIFGLSLGAAVGALSAILVHKNSDKEVVQNFEAKVKDFFQDLIKEFTTSATGGSAFGEKKAEVIKKVDLIEKVVDFIEEKVPAVNKKSAPKTFIKPKK